MGRSTLLALAVVLGAAALVGWVWVLQNADQVVTLRLDLGGFGAWRTASPVPATLLAVGGFGGGALLGFGAGLLARRRGRSDLPPELRG